MKKIIVSYKRIYEVNDEGKKYWVLILFDISGYHYVGIRVYQNPTKSTIYIKSIDKHLEMYGIKEYTQSQITRCIYDKRKPLEVNDSEFSLIYQNVKESMLSYLEKKIYPSVDGVTYLKWCKDKYILNNNYSNNSLDIKQHAVYWINMGYGVGSEIRKIRPAIVWRMSRNKEMCTIIPLTSKNLDDNYYFHIDLDCLESSTAKIEYMENISRKRILAPYFSKNKLTFITSNDREKIITAIEKYYLFKFDTAGNTD